VIGYGAPTKQGTAAAHGSPLGAGEARAAKQNLGWQYAEPFTVPEQVEGFRRAAVGAGQARHAEWEQRFARYQTQFPELAAEFRRAVAGALPAGWQRSLPSFEPGGQVATRSASGKVLNAVASVVAELVGGSADLAPSTDTYLEGFADVSCGEFSGRNFHFGVREHAMGAVLNGLAAHGGLRPFGGTFFVFSDYLRPAIRMAALMRLPVVFVFTHDSIGLGEDGPTHQPVEHLAALRAIPNLLVIRPADANEMAQAWGVALARAEGPAALVLSRQKLPVLAKPPQDAVARGAHVTADGTDLVLVATGSEVHLALSARELLAASGISARVVSMPCWELFESQPAGYQQQVLPPGVPRLGVEAAGPFGWCAWADDVVSLDRFGASAPAQALFGEFGFTPENVAARARGLLARRGGS
jgi:transketolase